MVQPSQAVFLTLQFFGDHTISKLLDEVRTSSAHVIIAIAPNSYRTEEAYLNWIRQYIPFHGKRHPAEMGADQVTQFLTHLAVVWPRQSKCCFSRSSTSRGYHRRAAVDAAVDIDAVDKPDRLRSAGVRAYGARAV